MLFAASVLNYIDRSILGIVAPALQERFGMSDAAYALVADAFLVAYTLAYLFSGRLIDSVGARLSLGLFVGFWSLANTLTAAVWSFASLGVCRFFLGLGEAGGYAASPKAVAEWFGRHERGLAVGLYSLGGPVGATVTPLLVAGLSPHVGWRGVFIVTGVLGLLWVPAWLWAAEPHPPATGAAPPPADAAATRWSVLLRQPVVWRLTVARLLTDAVWFFYLFWLPKYFATTWHVTQERMGLMAYVFLASGIGFVGGGLVSGWLVRRTTPAYSRLCLMAAAACVVPVLAAVPTSGSLPTVVGLTSLVAAAHCVWLGNITTLVVDTVPTRRLATTYGVIAAGSAAGGIGMNSLVTLTIHRYSYNATFYAMAAMHLIALLIVWPVGRHAVDQDR